ncbi:P-loop containing nucleoside triphosphate hydrolase protein [Aspergillus granulosus]|uniref:ATP-dependent RNA helicase n=1 Tax=Aspergillus granulosus TaxID=176169 RepID=A0ABR4HTC8_9EURO
MLGAFRRSAVSHALRSSARTVSARSTPERFRFLSSSISIPSYAPRSLFHSSSLLCNSQANAAVQNDLNEDQLSGRFSELAEKNLIDPSIIKTITGRMGIETMTDVQRQTIPLTVRGDDVLAQAKTGTGKTIAFLLPVMQKLVSDPDLRRFQVQQRTMRNAGRRGPRASPMDIRAIIISPTRELAEQIAVEARRIAQGSGIVVQTAVGGTQKRFKLMQLQREGCHILVATPGRLRDILSDPSSGVEAPKLSTLVLDEADRLLDDGFGPEIMEIQQLLPDPSEVPRQTLMFSATMAREVMGMVRQTMKRGFSFVKTIKDDEVPTHLSVPQKAVIVQGFENLLPAILQMAKRAHANRHASERPFKAIVYFNSNAEVDVGFEAFDRLLNDPEDQRSRHPLGNMVIGGINSRLTQSARTRVADNFRRCKSGILFSSDVTARGMDFPEVTHVIQVGPPKDRETYIHRLGRTARANKTGEGWVFLHPLEQKTFKRTLQGIPVETDTTSLPIAHLDLSIDLESIRDSRPEDYEAIQQIHAAMKEIPPLDRLDACKKQMFRSAQTFDHVRQVSPAADKLAVLGYKLEAGPEINPGIAQKLGLTKRDGFRIKSANGFRNRDGGFSSHRSSGFGGRRNGGFGGGRRDSREGRDGRDRRDRNRGGRSWGEERTNEWI